MPYARVTVGDSEEFYPLMQRVKWFVARIKEHVDCDEVVIVSGECPGECTGDDCPCDEGACPAAELDFDAWIEMELVPKEIIHRPVKLNLSRWTLVYRPAKPLRYRVRPTTLVGWKLDEIFKKQRERAHWIKTISEVPTRGGGQFSEKPPTTLEALLHEGCWQYRQHPELKDPKHPTKSPEEALIGKCLGDSSMLSALLEVDWGLVYSGGRTADNPVLNALEKHFLDGKLVGRTSRFHTLDWAKLVEVLVANVPRGDVGRRLAIATLSLKKSRAALQPDQDAGRPGSLHNDRYVREVFVRGVLAPSETLLNAPHEDPENVREGWLVGAAQRMVARNDNYSNGKHCDKYCGRIVTEFDKYCGRIVSWWDEIEEQSGREVEELDVRSFRAALRVFPLVILMVLWEARRTLDDMYHHRYVSRTLRGTVRGALELLEKTLEMITGEHLVILVDVLIRWSDSIPHWRWLSSLPRTITQAVVSRLERAVHGEAVERDKVLDVVGRHLRKFGPMAFPPELAFLVGEEEERRYLRSRDLFVKYLRYQIIPPLLATKISACSIPKSVNLTVWKRWTYKRMGAVGECLPFRGLLYIFFRQWLRINRIIM